MKNIRRCSIDFMFSNSTCLASKFSYCCSLLFICLFGTLCITLLLCNLGAIVYPVTLFFAIATCISILLWPIPSIVWLLPLVSIPS
ncbi:hypothetical protein CPC08DRAFT_340179 [Agrocybe pediades]|nr:hypothetical protein CPC08DRAFT_340179 [Agrocybe pediades]